MTLAARQLRLGYGRTAVVAGIDLRVEPGSIVAVIGPNGSGKSTLLRGLARLLRPLGGVVELDGRSLAAWSAGALAREVALLSQQHEPPGDMTVRELVALGRHPHQGLLSLPSAGDAAGVALALEQTDLTALSERRVGELSGGERQRAWFALSLAQEPRVLLLDEPTTFLDLGHQLAVLDLVARLNATRGLTVVMALHDLGQAARYAGRVVLMTGGAVAADGSPENVLTAERIREAYGVEVEVLRAAGGTPVIVPLRLSAQPAGGNELSRACLEPSFGQESPGTL